MAIDTAAKRRSVGGVGRFFRGPGVTPDATPDAFWRQTVGRSYGGITAGSGGAVAQSGSRYRYGYQYGRMSGLLMLLRG